MRIQFGAGLRLHNQFAVFTYSQLQNILPDNVLGKISDWERYLTIDLSRTDLPFKTADEFILNEDYHRLATTVNYRGPVNSLSKLSRFANHSVEFYCHVKSSDLI